MKPLDADFNETDEVHGLRSLPGVMVSLGSLAKQLAYYNGPVEFRCEREAGSNTGVRFTISFTDAAGIHHAVSSKYFRQLMLQAAAIEQKAYAQARKQRLKGYDKKQPTLI